MRIKLDENLPVSLQPILRNLRHDVDSVVTEGLAGKTTSPFGLRRKKPRDSS